MIYGTDDGVYFSNLTEPDRPPVMVLQLMDVTQVDVLEQFQLLIVLSGARASPFLVLGCHAVWADAICFWIDREIRSNLPVGFA